MIGADCHRNRRHYLERDISCALLTPVVRARSSTVATSGSHNQEGR